MRVRQQGFQEGANELLSEGWIERIWCNSVLAPWVNASKGCSQSLWQSLDTVEALSGVTLHFTCCGSFTPTHRMD